MKTSTRMMGINRLPRRVVTLANWFVQPINRMAVRTLAMTSAQITEK